MGTVTSLRPLAVGRSGDVFVHSTTGIQTFRPDGTRKWTFAPGSAGTGESLILDRDENVSAAIGDTVYCVSPDRGQERWRVPIKSPGTLILGDAHTVYVVSEGRTLYAVVENSSRAAVANPSRPASTKD